MHSSEEPLKFRTSKINFGQITKLRKERICERFHDYAEITQIVDDDLHLYFPQHVDDGTHSTLKLVNLNEDEKRNCALFWEKYRNGRVRCSKRAMRKRTLRVLTSK